MMKQIILSIILGIVVLFIIAAICVGTLLFILNAQRESQNSMAKIENVFKENAEAFYTVQTYIDNFDLTPYEKESAVSPSISIIHPDTLPESSKYAGWIFTNKTYDLIIDDDTVNAALDQLFRGVAVVDITQTNDESARSIYFYITYSVGLVHSKSGDVPTDYPDDMGYTFQRINDNWFYWKHKG
jgi:hypothetical protein